MVMRWSEKSREMFVDVFEALDARMALEVEFLRFCSFKSC